MELTFRANGIGQNVFKAIWWRPHVEVGVEESCTVVIIILYAVTCHVFAFDDGNTLVEITGKNQRSNSVANRADGLIFL